MADIDILVDREVFAALAAGVLLLMTAAEVGTESFSLPTYYPAPSGIYQTVVATQDAYLARDGGNVGVGTTNPQATLEVDGPVKIADGTQGPGRVLTSDASGTAAWRAPAGMPSGAVMFFNQPSCPAGWSEMTLARGRYLVGLPASGALAATVGTALRDLENRPVGTHTHGVSDPGHRHDDGWGMSDWQLWCYAPSNVNIYIWSNSPEIITTASAVTGISLGYAGAVGGTNAPYLQLLVCQKN